MVRGGSRRGAARLTKDKRKKQTVNGRGEQSPQPSKRFWRLLKNGDTWNEYHGAVALIGAIVGLAVEYGVPLEKLERLLTNPANAAAAHVRFQGNPTGRVKLATVRYWYERSGQQQLHEWNLDAHRQKLDEVQQLATTRTWPSFLEAPVGNPARVLKVKGSDARRVLAAHVRLARRSRGIDYPASRRRLAHEANVGDGVAERASKVLVALGVLQRRRPPGRVGAFTAANYRVMTDATALAEVLGNGSDELAELAWLECHPLWRQGSGVRFDVWAHVVAEDGCATVAGIATATGTAPATARRVVRNLEEYGLVERTLDGTIRSTSSTNHRNALDAVALECGAVERSRRQLERHEDERAQHVARVMRSPARFAEAMRRRVRAVVEALQARVVVNRATGEVVDVLPPDECELAQAGNRAHAPPGAVA